MKLRTLVLTVAVLAVLSVLVYFVRRPAPPASADARINQPMLANAIIDHAAKVRLSEQGKTVDLAKQADGIWRVTSYYDFPADVPKLSTLLAAFTDAKAQRVIANPERVARLELKDSTVQLRDAADRELWSVTLGKNADAGGGRFVRFGAEPKAYLANLDAWLDADPKAWARAELLGLKAEDVAKIEIPFTNGAPVAVSREKKDSPWTASPTPAGQKLNTDKISTLAGELASLRFNDTAEPADAKVTEAKQHLRTLTLTTFGGQTYTIALGRKPEEKKPKPPAVATKGENTAATKPADAAKTTTPAEAKPADVAPAKPAEPEFETIPAGPVYAFITSNDATAPINAMMQKRAFEISDYTFTELPQQAADLFEPASAPAPKPATSSAPEPAPGKS